MLLRFSVSNYRCFRKLQTLNLAASSQDKTLPENCFVTDAPGLTGKRWNRGIALYGANASGKTTFLEALRALGRMVIWSARTIDPKEPIPQIEPFALGAMAPPSPTGFGVVFISEGIRYEYRVAATLERIWHESLRAFPKAKEQLWFSRDWQPESGNYAWTPDRPSGFQRDPQLEGYTLSNVLFLSKAVASNRGELDPVFRWFKEKLKFLDPIQRGAMGTEFTLKQVEERTIFHRRIVELLRHADLGVTGVNVVEPRVSSDPWDQMVARFSAPLLTKPGKEKLLQPELTHRGAGGIEMPLPWPSESEGTRRFFALAGPWLEALDQGCMVCIDELETSLHPLMVRELLRLFFTARGNPKGAQILFTTHNPLLLDATLLRRDQVWFMDKDAEGEAYLYPLTDYSPRQGESLVRGYMSGRYGAVPFLPAGLPGSVPVPVCVGGAKENGHE